MEHANRRLGSPVCSLLYVCGAIASVKGIDSEYSWYCDALLEMVGYIQISLLTQLIFLFTISVFWLDIHGTPLRNASFSYSFKSSS